LDDIIKEVYLEKPLRTKLNLKNVVFLDVALCRSCVNRRFGGTYGLYLQGRKIRECGTSVIRWLKLISFANFMLVSCFVSSSTLRYNQHEASKFLA
jgi:hypothetical protein